jgi:phosphomevalonate kinase
VARRVGAAAKPSGAGGGDCAIALVEASRHAALREAWSACGLRPLDVALSPEGVRVTRAKEGAHV